MPPFDRRRSFPDRTASGRTTPAVFTSDDLDRDLTALMQDPLYWRERDADFTDHVTRQFERVHGPDGPTPDGVVAPDGPTIQRVNAEAADTADVADSHAPPPLPARKPGSDVTPASPDKRRTIGATREERVDPAYQRTEADLLLGEISRTRIDIVRKEAEIERLAENIEAERQRRRGILIETAKEASPMSSKLPKVFGLTPLGRAAITGAEVGTAVSDLPADIGEMRNIPRRVEGWEKDLDRLRQDRDALLEKLDRLETERGHKYPRHVPPFTPRGR
jgi:hypothetical protein